MFSIARKIIRLSNGSITTTNTRQCIVRLYYKHNYIGGYFLVGINIKRKDILTSSISMLAHDDRLELLHHVYSMGRDFATIKYHLDGRYGVDYDRFISRYK